MAGPRGEPGVRAAPRVDGAGRLTLAAVDLPVVSSRRVAVRVTKDALRQVRAGHPWVFDRSVTDVGHDAAPGDLAVVFDDRRRFAAIGLWDPSSPIRIRILHHGGPATIDAEWWRARIRAAFVHRATLTDDPRTNAYRVVHGENDGFPGLVVDRYDRTLVMKAYSAAWLPHLRTVASVLDDVIDSERVVLRVSRSVRRDGPGLDGVALVGDAPTEPVPFVEHDLAFEADVLRGQKTGHFLDQRDNRIRVGRLAGGRQVLDVFSCTGGFSVHAAAGGAAAVTSVDQSSQALATARRNMERNAGRALVRTCRHDVITGDAFDVMADLARRGRRFDLVVVDPPSFASRQASVPSALHGYGRLTALAVDLLEPGGTLVQASCSSRVSAEELEATVQRSVRAAGRSLDVFERTVQPLDHPIGFPEGAYLKAIFAVIS